MDDLGIIDGFTQTFSRYVDSGFGLLQGDVAFLTSILVGIDITLAGLFWALNNEDNVIGQLVRKVLYVGFFALLLNNFQYLANVIFDSFAGLGLEATGRTLEADQLLRPGFVAAAGFEAAHPLLEAVESMLGFTSFFNHAPTILILLFAWIVILISFFILAVQIFVTVIEFKLTTLAGFVLVPFALWNRTSFLAERVLGNVIAAGIKLMVLAVVVGIGSTLFANVAAGLAPDELDIERAASVMLGAIALLGLGIFGPGIAAGLVSGAPQLGAGAAVGTAAGVAAGGMAGAGLASGAARMAGASRSVEAAAALTGGATAAYGLARSTSGVDGIAGVAAGLAGVAQAGVGAAAEGAQALGARATEGIRSSFREGQLVAYTATGGVAPSRGAAPASAPPDPGAAPEWARKLRSEQRLREAGMMAANTIREGDRPANADAPRLRDEE